MFGDNPESKVTPLFRKEWYTVSANESAPKPARPLPPLTYLNLSVHTGIDVSVTDKLTCAPGDEVSSVLILAERVINMLRARRSLPPVSVCAVSREDEQAQLPTQRDADGEQA